MNYITVLSYSLPISTVWAGKPQRFNLTLKSYGERAHDLVDLMPT
jgi:hypothetical protein